MKELLARHIEEIKQYLIDNPTDYVNPNGLSLLQKAYSIYWQLDDDEFDSLIFDMWGM